MGLYPFYLINFVITAVVAAGVFAYWLANRKRIAAETIGRADEQALRTLKDAERDGENRKKEALLEAKEKAHELRTEAERVARDKTQQLADLEQQLNRRDQSLTDKLATAERKDKDLQARTQSIADKESPSASRWSLPTSISISCGSPLRATSSSLSSNGITSSLRLCKTNELGLSL